MNCFKVEKGSVYVEENGRIDSIIYVVPLQHWGSLFCSNICHPNDSLCRSYCRLIRSNICCLNCKKNFCQLLDTIVQMVQ